jgi:hypothetical protein
MPPNNEFDDHRAIQVKCIQRFANIEQDTAQIAEIRTDVKTILAEQKRINGTTAKHNLILVGEDGMPGLVSKHEELETAVTKLRPKVIALWILLGLLLPGMGFLAAWILLNAGKIPGG